MTNYHQMTRLGVLIIACMPSELRAQDATVTLEGHAGGVRAVAFSPDGKTLASGGEDWTIKLWTVEAFKVKRAEEGQP